MKVSKKCQKEENPTNTQVVTALGFEDGNPSWWMKQKHNNIEED